MEATEVKSKRKYTKISMETNLLTQLLVERQIKFKEICDLYGVGFGTAKRYMLEPKRLNGYQRKSLAEFLNLSIEETTSLIDK